LLLEVPLKEQEQPILELDLDDVTYEEEPVFYPAESLAVQEDQRTKFKDGGSLTFGLKEESYNEDSVNTQAQTELQDEDLSVH